MNKLLEMRPIELQFKRMYQGLEPNDVKLVGEFWASEKYDHTLLENSFFQEQLDIMAVHHIRYLPPDEHFHEFFEIACILSGEFTNHTANDTMTLHTGDIMILSPNTTHSVCTFSDDGILINILVKKSTFEQHFLNLLPQNNILYSFFFETLYTSSTTPYIIFHTGGDESLQTKIIQILDESARNNRYKNTMLSSMLSIFFVELMRNHEKDLWIPTIDAGLRNEDTIFIIEYLQQNYQNITLHHLAEFFNYSDRQMQRIIKTLTGLSFNQLIKKMRMEKAKELLITSSLTVREIGDFLGFYDVSSFRKTFRDYYGCSPQNTRK